MMTSVSATPSQASSCGVCTQVHQRLGAPVGPCLTSPTESPLTFVACFPQSTSRRAVPSTRGMTRAPFPAVPPRENSAFSGF